MRAERHNDRAVAFGQKPYSSRRFNGNTFDTKMSPDDQALNYPNKATPLTAKPNPYYNVEYVGEPNIADNTVANSLIDRSSSQYKLVDQGTMSIETYYLGLAMVQGRSKNLAYNKQFVDTALEALSATYATQLTDQPFLNMEIETSIPEMESGKAAKLGFEVMYQQVQQSFMAVFAKYVSTMSQVDEMVKMGYNGEAPITTQLTNLFKKAAFYGLFDQLGITIKQEYCDLDWFRQINALGGVPSRKASDVNNPRLTIVPVPYIPDVKMRSPTTPTSQGIEIFNSYTDPCFTDIKVQVKRGNDVETKTYAKLHDLVHHILCRLDPFYVVQFCREVYNGNSNDTVTYYFNELFASVEALIKTASRFKDVTTAFDAYLMVLQDNTQLNNWVVNVPYESPGKPKPQAESVFMGLVNNIFTAYGTSGNLIWDDNTLRWAIYTKWSEYDGIVDYDYYDGGFMIATSVRDVPDDPNADYMAIRYKFPVMFKRFGRHKGVDTYQQFSTRDGFTFSMKTETLTAARIANDPALAGLNSMNNPAMSIERPVVQLSEVTGDPLRQWSITRVVSKLFGIARVALGDYNYSHLNPDIHFYVGRQFNNTIEASTEYLECASPQRISSGDATLGFRTN